MKSSGNQNDRRVHTEIQEPGCRKKLLVLARMINIDEEAFICDMAETYHIYDYKSLPLRMVGIFACGLRQNSRIAMKISGAKFSLEQIVLAAIADGTRMTAWLNSMNGDIGIKKPRSLVEILLGN